MKIVMEYDYYIAVSRSPLIRASSELVYDIVPHHPCKKITNSWSPFPRDYLIS